MSQDYEKLMREVLAEKRGSIDGIEAQLAEKQQRAQDMNVMERVNLAPAAALIDSLQGSNISGGIKGPTPFEKNQMVIAKLQDAAMKGKDQYGDAAMNYFKTNKYLDIAEADRERGKGNDDFDRWYKKQTLADSRKTKAANAGKKGGLNLTKGQEKVDQIFAKTYNEEFLSGKLAAAQGNLANLDDVTKALAEKKGLTGGVAGNTPMFMRRRFFQESAGAQQKVEYVVQQSLKAILGAQFTKEEAERLIERSYDPALSEEMNLKRVARLKQSLSRALAAKQNAAEYYQKNRGTLDGYDGVSAFSVDGILADMEGDGSGKKETMPDFGNFTDEQLEQMAKGQ